MDPMTVATAFASIVGLIGTYKAEAKAGEDRNFDQYIDWLRRQEHQHVVALILSNNEFTRSVRDLIEDKHGEVMAKLESLDKVLAGVASRIDVFQPLANLVGMLRLSDQSVSVLRQLNEANASQFRIDRGCRAGKTYPILGVDVRRSIQFGEPRFIEDDLLTLCEYGLLRLSHNDNGDRVFAITREGAVIGETP